MGSIPWESFRDSSPHEVMQPLVIPYTKIYGRFRYCRERG